MALRQGIPCWFLAVLFAGLALSTSARKLLQTNGLAVCYAAASENDCVIVISGLDHATCDSEGAKYGLTVLTDDLGDCYAPLPLSCTSDLSQIVGQTVDECGSNLLEVVQKNSAKFDQAAGEGRPVVDTLNWLLPLTLTVVILFRELCGERRLGRLDHGHLWKFRHRLRLQLRIETGGA